ncbi:hypothetical protein A2188_02265 [Candidatus Woesebacteria bacterium RIFOXYA1_FULL_43_9]|uniref:Uncharacterized protein n=1 Tax=Candidatus Woesebacteria bacterium RIFOXYA1_FULL_43_9 TaxID=1802534 RepID=A0A1F8CPP9_9BACT|nr:MAG: hypothetical protein A2188_02265 [Candidatus Woesebacteria bacterium RIFOXYA1_FULL_43_9]
MAFVWDYNVDELKKTESGKALLLERTLNFGPEKGEIISSSLVKKYWDRMNLFPKTRRLMELLIWGKTQSSTPSNG